MRKAPSPLLDGHNGVLLTAAVAENIIVLPLLFATIIVLEVIVGNRYDL